MMGAEKAASSATGEDATGFLVPVDPADDPEKVHSVREQPVPGLPCLPTLDKGYAGEVIIDPVKEDLKK